MKIESTLTIEDYSFLVTESVEMALLYKVLTVIRHIQEDGIEMTAFCWETSLAASNLAVSSV